MSHKIQCSCGQFVGALKRSSHVNRCICYCKDCQAFAHFLDRAKDILDDAGGTDIIQTTPSNITLDKGVENLACVRLSASGLFRWYASCCNTPIGNTPANIKMSIIGLIHNCLKPVPCSFEEAFGPVRVYVHTRSAKGEVKPKQAGVASGIIRAVGMMLKARITGDYRNTPFFDAVTASPKATPTILSEQELEKLKNVV